MRGGWTKVFSSMLTSSVWCEDHATVRVWVAMLLMVDKRGVVEGAVPGLASLCRMSVPELEAALTVLSAPDPHSRTPDHDGRRIEAVEGGWKVLNYRAYSERCQNREGSRAPYMRSYRKRAVTRNTAPVTGNTELLRVTPDSDLDSDSENVRVITTSSLASTTQPTSSARATTTTAGELANRYVAAFNATFDRKLRLTPALLSKVEARIKARYRPWQIVSLPILVDAQGLPADMRREIGADVLLRDGKKPRTSATGQTFGATDWLERALGRLDRTTLDERQAAIAETFGVLGQLRESGVGVRQESGL